MYRKPLTSNNCAAILCWDNLEGLLISSLCYVAKRYLEGRARASWDILHILNGQYPCHRQHGSCLTCV